MENTQHIWINPERLSNAFEEAEVEGIDLMIELSPYDAPKAIVGEYSEKRGKFDISFEYIDEEPEKLIDESSDGIRAFAGKHSEKLLRLSIPIDHAPLDKAAIIQLRTNVFGILEKIGSRGKKGRLNHRVANQLLGEDFDKLQALVPCG